MKEIKELRGVTRFLLTSYGPHWDIYIEVCHEADPKVHKDAFCIQGKRYVIVDCRDGSEHTATFASEVENYLKLCEMKESGEELVCHQCKKKLENDQRLWSHNYEFFCSDGCVRKYKERVK